MKGISPPTHSEKSAQGWLRWSREGKLLPGRGLDPPPPPNTHGTPPVWLCIKIALAPAPLPCPRVPPVHFFVGGVPGSEPFGAGLKHPIRPHAGGGGSGAPPSKCPPAPLRPLCSQGLGTVTPHRVRGVRCPPGFARALQPPAGCSRTPCALCCQQSSQIPPRKTKKKPKTVQRWHLEGVEGLKEGSGGWKRERSRAGGCVLLPCALVLLRSIPWEEEWGARGGCSRVGAAPGCTPRPGPAPGRFGEPVLA